MTDRQTYADTYHLRVINQLKVYKEIVEFDGGWTGDVIIAGVEVIADKMVIIPQIVEFYKRSQETWFHLRPGLAQPVGWILGRDKFGIDNVERLIRLGDVVTEAEYNTEGQVLEFLRDLHKKRGRKGE
jgi:hypothetical protein